MIMTGLLNLSLSDLKTDAIFFSLDKNVTSIIIYSPSLQGFEAPGL